MKGSNIQMANLADQLNQAYFSRTLCPENIEQSEVELIPTQHASAILDNCLQIVFFPYGAKAPESSAEFEKVVSQMSATLVSLNRNIAEHKIVRKLSGREILAQYNAYAIFYGFGSIRIRELIANELRIIKLLIKNAASDQEKTGYTRIGEVADKLGRTVFEATNLLEKNFLKLADSLMPPEAI